MGDVLVLVVIVAALVVGAALVARVNGRGRLPGGGSGGRRRSGPAGAGGAAGRGSAGGGAAGAGGAAGRGSAGGGAAGGGAAPGVRGPGARHNLRAGPGSGPPAGPAAGAGARATGEDPAASTQDVIGPAVRRPPATPAASLDELLAGAELPHGLVPATGPDLPDQARYRALTTAAAGAADDVGSAVGDELERLGYQLHSLSDDEAVARRGDDLLSLRLHPDAADAQLAGRPLFPGAAPGMVGIELWPGAGPSPRES